MTLNDLQKMKILQTAGIMADIQADPTDATHLYVVEKLRRFYSGDYGNVGKRQTEANNKVLSAGHGRIVATYEKGAGLTDHIYIIAILEEDTGAEDIDNNHIVIMHCKEN